MSPELAGDAKAVWRRVSGRASQAARAAYWRLRIKPPSSTIERIKADKAARKATGLLFLDAPRVSVIVQSFNQVRNIATLEERLRATCMDELIVCEDGSLDGSHEQWALRLTRPNDFLIRSNDLHEIRTYARAIDYARGEFICLIQDDDRPPADGAWLGKALRMFELYPRLAVLGGWCGFNNYFEEEYNAPWLRPGQGAIPYVDPKTQTPFMFVENVNIGPYILRRKVYQQLGGFDLNFSAPGTPGICFESEFCYRAWKHGFHVGLMDLPIKIQQAAEGYAFPGGTFLWARPEREHNERANKRRIAALYDPDLPAIQERVRQANSLLSRRAD